MLSFEVFECNIQEHKLEFFCLRIRTFFPNVLHKSESMGYRTITSVLTETFYRHFEIVIFSLTLKIALLLSCKLGRSDIYDDRRSDTVEWINLK